MGGYLPIDHRGEHTIYPGSTLSLRCDLQADLAVHTNEIEGRPIAKLKYRVRLVFIPRSYILLHLNSIELVPEANSST